MGSQKKTLLYLLVAGCLVAFAGLLYFQFSQREKQEIILSSVPDDAEITLNGKRVSPGSLRVSPGSYEFRGTKEGFETTESKVQVSDRKDVINVRLLLNPVSADAREWAQNNQGQYLRLEEEAAQESINEGDEFSDKFPISRLLPYENLLFSINYTAESSKSGFRLEIGANSSVDRRYAIEQIRNWGYEPGDYEIAFIDFENPLLESAGR